MSRVSAPGPADDPIGHSLEKEIMNRKKDFFILFYLFIYLFWGV